MKKLLLILCATLINVYAMAQTEYISYSAAEEKDQIADLNGNCGILILSKRSDLVISITNATNASKYRVSPTGIRPDGYYAYEVSVDKSEDRAKKVEVSRRGDVYKTSFVVAIKPDFFRAYIIEEVQKPIRMEDQTQATSSILNEELAEVEFTTTIPDLKVVCAPALNAKITTSKKAGDRSINITTVTIPIKVLESARQKQERTKKTYDELSERLNNSTNASDKDWENLDKLQEETDNAEREFREMSNISIYGVGTNRLSVDIMNIRPRQKFCYGVLLLKVEVPVNDFSAKIAEGGRLFALREYDGARRSFSNALNLKEATEDLIPTVKTNIAQCDSCLLYERYASGALAKMKNEKTQEEVVRYAEAALEFIRTLNLYNPCEFYSSRISKLEKIISEQPLDIKFTMARWVNNYEGFYEGAVIPNVEIWAHYGTSIPAPNDYKNDKRFYKLMGSSEYKKLGESDNNGVYNLHLDRNGLPTGLFFHPVGYNNKIKTYYKDMKEIMRESEGSYNKRQFRLKMYSLQ